MKELLDNLSRQLTKDDVELRIGQTSQNGFSLLLYKTARTDVKRLNDCGAIWKNEHIYDSLGLLTCVISLYDTENKLWIDRSDVGTESQTEKQKGLYSDSFKRAGFRWGIGLELYNAPFIWIKWDMEKNQNGKWQPKGFYATNLHIDSYEVIDGEFVSLVISYDNEVKFSMNGYKTYQNATGRDMTAYKKKFMSNLKENGVDDVLDFFNFIGTDHTKVQDTHNEVVRFLKDKDNFEQQVESYLGWKAKQAS